MEEIAHSSEQIMENSRESLNTTSNGIKVDGTKAHQCSVCDKIFTSLSGLIQHSVSHTNERPFDCDICGKAFRFKSNMYEHRSVHSGYALYNCPYCDKKCRLKGNLKKHLKTHVNTKDELDEAWKPFSSNRRAPQKIPQDAEIVRSSGGPLVRSKKKLGLGADSQAWVEKIRQNELLPTDTLEGKLDHLADKLKSAEENSLSMDECFEDIKAIPLERFDCPLCKSVFQSRLECGEHVKLEHPTVRVDPQLFCQMCLRVFADQELLEQHESYHRRVQRLLELRKAQIADPEPQDPEQMFTFVEEVVVENIAPEQTMSPQNAENQPTVIA